jgi:hypothetical protein
MSLASALNDSEVSQSKMITTRIFIKMNRVIFLAISLRQAPQPEIITMKKFIKTHGVIPIVLSAKGEPLSWKMIIMRYFINIKTHDLS